MSLPMVSLDQEADAVYVQLVKGVVARTRSFGDLRNVDYAPDGSVVGIEFIGASEGIDLTGLPRAEEIGRAIGKSGLPIKIYAS